MSIDSVQSVLIHAASSGCERPKQKELVAEEVPPSVPAPTPLPEARTLQVSASFGDGHLVIYRILDKETGQLVEQIPPQQFLDAARNTEELALNEAPDQKLNLKF